MDIIYADTDSVKATRELFIDVDNQIIDEVRNRLFQNQMFSLVQGELIPKNKGCGYFLEVVIAGLKAGNLHNSYRQILTEVFKDDITSKESVMVRGCKKCTPLSLPILYSSCMQFFYRYYGEFQY